MDRELKRVLEASPEGRAYLAAKKKAKAASRARTAPRRKAGDEKKRLSKEESAFLTARLRRQAVYRSEGRGELCGEEFEADEAQMCHLDGGSGKRTQKQWIGNVVMEHPECHLGKNGLDRDPLRWLENVRHFCARYGYPLPERFRKLEALSASSVRRAEGGR